MAGPTLVSALVGLAYGRIAGLASLPVIGAAEFCNLAIGLTQIALILPLIILLCLPCRKPSSSVIPPRVCI